MFVIEEELSSRSSTRTEISSGKKTKVYVTHISIIYGCPIRKSPLRINNIISGSRLMHGWRENKLQNRRSLIWRSKKSSWKDCRKKTGDLWFWLCWFKHNALCSIKYYVDRQRQEAEREKSYDQWLAEKSETAKRKTLEEKKKEQVQVEETKHDDKMSTAAIIQAIMLRRQQEAQETNRAMPALTYESWMPPDSDIIEDIRMGKTPLHRHLANYI